MERKNKEEINTIENVPELERDGVLKRAAINRKRDRQELEKNIHNHQWSKFNEEKVLDTNNTDNKRNEQQEKLRRQVSSQFRVINSNYYDRDGGQLAFREREDKFVTSHNNERVAIAMVTLAEAKGWTSIKVSGHPEFKQSVWMEASLRGVKVRGYTPKEHDIRELEQRQERLMRNSLERDQKKIGQGPAQREQDQSPGQENREQQQSPKLQHEGIKKAFRGKLLEHGSAPYEFDKRNEDSYYVKIENRKGVRTIWGVDLERAINKSGAEVGSKIELELKGKEKVVVKQREKDKDGNVIGEKQITAVRNMWNVELARSRTAEAGKMAIEQKGISAESPVGKKALAKINKELEQREKSGRVPLVPWYDRESQPTQERISAQRTEYQRERERER